MGLPLSRELSGVVFVISDLLQHPMLLDTADGSFVLDKTISVKDFCSTLDLTAPFFWNVLTFISIS